MDNEAKPLIPEQEFRERWKKVQAMMEKQGLDLLALYADDRAVFGPAHARWLADLPVHFEPVCILMPKTGDPILLCGPETDEYAILRGQIKDVRILTELSHPDEDYPYSTLQGLAEVVSEVIGDISSVKRMGIAGKGLMNTDLYSAYEKALPSVEWADVENEVCHIRAVKSAAEIEVTKYAYTIAEKGINAAIEAIRPGATEREIAAEAEAAMRRAGAEGTGIDTIVASGPNSRPILARSTFRKVEENDVVLLTIVPRYEGYHAAIGRVVQVGSPGVEVQKALEVAWEGQKKAAAQIKSGIEGRNVEAVGRKIVEEAGFGKYFLYSGIHSMGVIEFEPPIFGPGSSAKLEKDMIICIDIPMFNTPWGTGVRVENGYLVTEDGAECLTNISFDIRK